MFLPQQLQCHAGPRPVWLRSLMSNLWRRIEQPL
jgi:hypothetical protein